MSRRNNFIAILSKLSKTKLKLTIYIITGSIIFLSSCLPNKGPEAQTATEIITSNQNNNNNNTQGGSGSGYVSFIGQQVPAPNTSLNLLTTNLNSLVTYTVSGQILGSGPPTFITDCKIILIDSPVPSGWSYSPRQAPTGLASATSLFALPLNDSQGIYNCSSHINVASGWGASNSSDTTSTVQLYLHDAIVLLKNENNSIFSYSFFKFLCKTTPSSCF